jgi:hypothetical protein
MTTMTIDVHGFHQAHEGIGHLTAELRIAARTLPMMTAPERELIRGDVLRLLHEQVEPHTKLDEELLYPAAAERLGDALVTASMNYDHLAIRDWIAQIEACNVDECSYLQELLYGLDALIRVHIWKEDALFLVPLESDWPAA